MLKEFERGPRFVCLKYFVIERISVEAYGTILRLNLNIVFCFDVSLSSGNRKRVRFWKGRSVVHISGRSNRTQYCQRLATVATFLRKEMCCLLAQ